MEKQRLMETLASLHAELSSSHELDQETRAALQTLRTDIERLIATSMTETAPAEATDSGINDRLREYILQFETRHPRLTSVLSQVADRLADLGI